ncbi:MAG: trehalose/maltose transport system substrate-binding protein [Thermoanaerobacteraceae bacterium]|nr:trehalose/maltose transport system substrate-binding protein [Thermoanaerobacteraceae bacterium]MDN5301175.1 trehalose/maltose transport system substrate-binding protein [Thermoanaerobacteraceae bacterium]
MFKKLLAVLLCIIIIGTLLTGCGNKNSAQNENKDSSQSEKSQDQSGEKVVITLNTYRDTTGTIQSIIDEFNKTHDNIEVKWVESPATADETHNTFVTYLTAQDSSTDIYVVDVIWVPEFAEAGWAYPLDEFVTKEEKDDIIPAALESFTYKGKLVAFPYYADGGMLYYRKDILDKEGLKPPKDWNELIDMASKLSKKYNMYGLTPQFAQYEGLICNFTEYLWGNGGDIIDKDGKVVVNSPQAVEALQFMIDMMKKYKIVPEGALTYREDESLQVFQEGKSIFHRNWAYAWGVVQGDNSKVKDKVGIVPMPAAPGKSDMPTSTFGPQGYMISKFSKHPKEAWEFLKFLTNKDNQKKLFAKAGMTPTIMSIYEDSEFAKDMPYLKQNLESFLKAKPRPMTPYYKQLSDILQINIHKALIGELSAKEALDKAAEEIEKVIR